MIKRILDGKILFMEEDAERAQKEQVFRASSTRMPTPTDKRKTLMDEHEHEDIKRLEEMITEKMKEVEELKEKVKSLPLDKKKVIDGRLIEREIL